MGLNPGFLAFLTCRIFSSSFAETVDLIVFETGMSMLSATRLPFGFMLDLAEAVEDEELLEDEDDDEEDDVVDESESESESRG